MKTSVASAVTADTMNTASKPQLAAITTPSAGIVICAPDAAIPKKPSPSPRREGGINSAASDVADVGHSAIPIPCTRRSASSDHTSCENTIRNSASAKTTVPSRIKRRRLPSSHQRPTCGRISSGSSPKPPTTSPTCHSAPPISST